MLEPTRLNCAAYPKTRWELRGLPELSTAGPFCGLNIRQTAALLYSRPVYISVGRCPQRLLRDVLLKQASDDLLAALERCLRALEPIITSPLQFSKAESNASEPHSALPTASSIEPLFLSPVASFEIVTNCRDGLPLQASRFADNYLLEDTGNKNLFCEGSAHLRNEPKGRCHGFNRRCELW